MRNLKNTLIVTDLDGTFFGSKTSLVQRNLDAVERLKAAGGYFTIATGRMYSNLEKPLPMAAELFNAPIIACNGALMYDMKTKKPLIERFIPHEDGCAAVEYTFRNFPDLGVRVSVPSGFMTSPEAIRTNPRIKKDMETCYPDSRVIVPYSGWTAHNWYKIIIRGESDRLDELRDGLARGLGDRFEISKSGATYFELQKKGTTKAAMLDELRRYCEAVAGHPLTLYAVGDYENDLAMLRHADVGVCPANALDSVKAVADLCLCDNNRGVIADLVEYIAAGE